MSEGSVGSQQFRGMGCYCARCTSCWCGLRAVVRVSKIPESYGREFYGCINYNRGGCNSFIWLDEMENGMFGCAFSALKQERNTLKSEIEEWKSFCKDLRKETKVLTVEINLLKEERNNVNMKYDRIRRALTVVCTLFGLVVALSLKSSPIMVRMLRS